MQDILDRLYKEGFDLGGSRYYREIASKENIFGEYDEFLRVTGESDWDFYFDAIGQSNKIVVLSDLGFELQENKFEDYSAIDENGEVSTDYFYYQFWTHPEHPIQINSKIDYKLYKEIFTTLGLNYFINHVWKSNPHRKIKNDQDHKKFVIDTFNMLTHMLDVHGFRAERCV